MPIYLPKHNQMKYSNLVHFQGLPNTKLDPKNFIKLVNLLAKLTGSSFLPGKPSEMNKIKKFLQIVSRYLKGRNICVKKISQISAKFAKIDSFFDPQQC